MTADSAESATTPPVTTDGVAFTVTGPTFIGPAERQARDVPDSAVSLVRLAARGHLTKEWLMTVRAAEQLAEDLRRAAHDVRAFIAAATEDSAS